MMLKLTLRLSILLYLAGAFAFFYFSGLDSMLWYCLGGGLALMNVFIAGLSVRFGLENLKKSTLFLGLLLVKSLSFLMIIAVVLVFLKPLLLPFTLGITIVIVGATLAGLWESKRLLKRKTPQQVSSPEV